jgi:hypothetical protein
MSNFLQKLLFAVPAAYAISCFASTNAFAASNTKPQAVALPATITNLDEASEAAINTIPDSIIAKNVERSESGTLIQPTSSEYTALQSLESKYGCSTGLTGVAVSREDFATSLNACLLKAEPVVAKNPSSVSAQDLEVLQRLTQEFRAELSNLDIRVEKVQQRTALAQSQGSQFSTTTKLKGEVIVGLNGVISGGGPGSNATVGNRVRLLLETTFTGKDKLYTRLATGNVAGYGNFRGGPALVEGAPTYAGNSGNAVAIDWLAYQFPLGNTSIYAAAYNGLHSDYVDTHNPYFEDFTGGNGAISSFAEENPIYKIGGGTGLGVTIPLNSGSSSFLDSVNLSYFAGTTANSPAPGNGLFGGRNSYLAQVNFKPSDKFNFGLTYVRAFHNGGAIFDFGGGLPVVGAALTTVGYSTSNSVGLSAAYQASDKLSLSGFITSTSADLTGGGNASILTYGVGAALPNVGQPGNLLGFFVGQVPSVTNVGLSNSYQLESFYKYKLNDNISVTPGLIYLTNPNQANGDGALIGTIRTTFTF